MEDRRPDTNPENEGAQAVGLRTSFSIHDPSKVWLVEAGSVDPFLILTRDGEPVSARHHVMRVEKGGAIFGVEPPSSTEMTIFAAANPESRLETEPA